MVLEAAGVGACQVGVVNVSSWLTSVAKGGTSGASGTLNRFPR